MPGIYAHTLPNQPRSAWETLDVHAANVARLAGKFASAFGAGDWGELLGKWHDLGKRSAEFQDYLRRTADPDASENTHGPDHSTFGGQFAAKTVGGHFGQLLAFCIAGHHGSLPDASTDDENTRGSTLLARLKKEVCQVSISAEDSVAAKLKLPFVPDRSIAGFSIAFFTRMLFSALVDADRIATEAFCDPLKAKERERLKPSVANLADALEEFLTTKQSNSPSTPVNQLRASVLADCLAASRLPPGFFSLNVPTGGGKTYSSLAFSLRHAEAHGLRRVVVAIPFTSIIEQTADAYRLALGGLAKDGLIEHHSNIDPKKETRSNKLACENWDAPLIVTTNVQLYESLFAAATTPCRKLHQLARSVIVLDEAQTIPVELLSPTLMALKELVAHYNCTVILCTATQPALEWREDFRIGIVNVCPIINNVPTLFTALKRVEVTKLGKMSDEALVERLAGEQAVLCIVNTRPHAAKLFEALIKRGGTEGCYHLSTFMCAAHRRNKLAEIRRKLSEEKPCRLVSTQLIEAGVDVDFPAVYRAPAGFDAIAQAAGRCNREGLRKAGRVYVFDTETPPPPGLQRSAAQCAQELMGIHPDPIAPEAIEAYFRLFYWSQQHVSDKYEVLEPLTDDFKRKELQLKFRVAASRYKIIRDDQQSILVPYNDEARKIRNRLMRGDQIDYSLLRAAQSYLVGVVDSVLIKLSNNHVISQHESGLWWLANDNAYTLERGLSCETVGFDPEMLMG